MLAGVPALVAAEIGYLLHDTVSLLLLVRRGRRLDKLLLLHHVAFVLYLPFYFHVALSQHGCHGDWYLVFLFLMNATTPFLHASYALERSRLRDGALHRAVRCLLVALFVLLRIAIFPYLMVVNVAFAGPACRLRWYCVAAAAVIAALNAVWLRSLILQHRCRPVQRIQQQSPHVKRA